MKYINRHLIICISFTLLYVFNTYAIEKIKGPATIKITTGTTFDLPVGFSSEVDNTFVTIFDPDNEIDMYFLELQEIDSKESAKEIWEKSNPDNNWKLERSFSPPPGQGFDEVYIENYRILRTWQFSQVYVRRKGNCTYSFLIRSTDQVLDKRRAQIKKIINSLKVPSIKEENFKEVKTQSIEQHQEDFTRFIEEIITKFKVPGLAIAIVENGNSVFKKGFGVREMGKTDPVTPDTLMMIGSVTKSFTTLLMATLVDDNTFSWSDKVVSVDPDFRLGDAGLTQNLLIEQLACACLGLPRKDLPMVFAYSQKSPPDVFKELAIIKPTTELKETFQYQNHMLAAAGYISAKAIDPNFPVGNTFDRSMQTRIFNPIGMTSTTLDFNAAINSNNRATPHALDLDGNNMVIPIDRERFTTYVRPAGGIWSSVSDMAAYMITELNNGISPNGKKVGSKKNLLYRRKSQIPTGANSSYGLGWGISNYKGLQIVGHGGRTAGFATRFQFIPEKNVGAVIISNSRGGHIAHGLIWDKLMSYWFNDNTQINQKISYILEERQKSRSLFTSRLSIPDKEEIKPFIGTHYNDELGEIKIIKEENEYIASINSYKSKLMKYKKKGANPSFVLMTPPFVGIRLYFNGFFIKSFTIARAQEKYKFKKK